MTRSERKREKLGEPPGSPVARVPFQRATGDRSWDWANRSSGKSTSLSFRFHSSERIAFIEDSTLIRAPVGTRTGDIEIIFGSSTEMLSQARRFMGKAGRSR